MPKSFQQGTPRNIFPHLINRYFKVMGVKNFYILWINVYYSLNTPSTESTQIQKVQRQPTKVVLKKRCSESMQQIYKRTPMPKCDFNKMKLHFGIDVLL